MTDAYNYDWSDVVFGSKKPLNSLKAVFITAPRELSAARFKQLIKTYLPSSNIVLGLSKEEFIVGFEGQPQFRSMQLKDAGSIIKKVNTSSSIYKIYTISYFQRETNYLLEKLKFQQVLFVNGSWKYAFHTRDIFYTLVQRKTPYQLISPFVNEIEAQKYVQNTDESIRSAYPLHKNGNLLTENEMLQTAANAARYSYDYNFQTGAALGKKSGSKYQLLTTAFNTVVPYQTFAMLHGASREVNFSPPNDLNHYDTVHAEVEILLNTQKQSLGLNNCSLFINLLPCPTCARMLCDSDISEVIYQSDHSSGYAISLLEMANKTVRRLMPDNIHDKL